MDYEVDSEVGYDWLVITSTGTCGTTVQRVKEFGKSKSPVRSPARCPSSCRRTAPPLTSRCLTWRTCHSRAGWIWVASRTSSSFARFRLSSAWKV